MTSRSYRFDALEILSFCAGVETPFYVISERRLAAACARLEARTGVPRRQMFYSLKTNYQMPVLRTLQRLGMGVEVYRKTELEIALAAGFAGDRIVMDGPAKNAADLKAALRRRVSLVNAESWQELLLLDEIAGAAGAVQPVGVRVHLGAGHFRNPFNIADVSRSKNFGFRKHDLHGVFTAIRVLKNIRLCCISAHASIPAASPGIFERRMRLLFEVAGLARRLGHGIDRIDLGGGYPAQGAVRLNLPAALGSTWPFRLLLRASEAPVSAAVGRSVRAAYEACVRRYAFAPRLLLEPGRAIVDDAMIVVGRVIEVRKNEVWVDISAITEVGYQPQFWPRRIIIANKADAGPRAGGYRFFGPTMSSLDVIATNVAGPRIERGDVVVVHNVGAYCASYSRPFMLPRCACYFVDAAGGVHLSRRPETYADMLSTQQPFGAPGPPPGQTTQEGENEPA